VSLPSIEQQTRNAYWPQLDGLRTVAFLLVLMHHLGPVTAENTPTLPWHVLLINTICSWGGSGVDLFFSLSGFLITFILLAEKQNFGDISFKLFFIRRALRIWPVYYFLLFVACVALPFSQWARLNHSLYFEFLFKQALPMALFLGNYSTIIATKVLVNFNTNLGIPIIYFLLPLWSLAVEEQFYLTWPFVLKAVRGARAMLGTIAGITIFSIAVRYVLWYISRFVWHLPFPVALYYQTTVSHLDALMAGAALATTAFYFPHLLAGARKYAPLMMLTATALMAGIVCYFPDIKYNTYHNVAVFTLIALICLLTVTSTLVSPALAKIFGSAPLAKFGRLTYAMYLVHYFAIACGDGLLGRCPIFGHSLTTMSPLSNWILRCAVSLTLTSLFALASWHLLEKKFQALRRHFARELQTAAAGEPNAKAQVTA
jgi:peptidoglycan/LPS O-acetylase OafA/YrhL